MSHLAQERRLCQQSENVENFSKLIKGLSNFEGKESVRVENKVEKVTMRMGSYEGL